MHSPIRVLHLGSPTGLYGAERWILALIRHLDPAEVQSTVAVIEDTPNASAAPLLECAAELGAKTHALRAAGRVNWAAVTLLRRYITDHKIDVLHTHFYKSDLIGLLAVRGTVCKIVTTPHGWSTGAGLALRAYEFVDRKAFRWFDAVAPLSNDIFTGLQKATRGNLHLIPNGVDLDEVDSVEVPSLDSLPWRSSNEFVVGYIGQLIARKGLDTLLRAFAGWRPAPAVKKRLVLVGEGEARGELEKLARELGIDEETSFLGYRGDRLRLLKSFSVFVLPSRLEGIPRCLMEAMAARVPVIASNIPGCKELLSDGKSGLPFVVDEHESLAAALQQQIESPNAQRVENARALVDSHYSAQRMAEKYSHLYRALIARGTEGRLARPT